MTTESLSGSSSMSTISTASSMHQQPRPPGGPKPTLQRFGHSLNRAGKVVRSPYLVTSTPRSTNPTRSAETLQLKRGVAGGSVRCRRRGNNDGGGGGSDGGEDGTESILWTPSQQEHIPHPSLPAYLQALMKTPGFSAVVVNPSGAKRSHPSTRFATSNKQHRLDSSNRNTLINTGSNGMATMSGDMDAIQLRDELVKMRKEMNNLMKERDIAKAQQV